MVKVYYDASCALCQKTVEWLRSIDKKHLLHFMALSDEMMQEGSVIVEADGKVYRRFAAIRHILFLMGWPWRAFAYLPEWIGDPCYRWVARLR